MTTDLRHEREPFLGPWSDKFHSSFVFTGSRVEAGIRSSSWLRTHLEILFWEWLRSKAAKQMTATQFRTEYYLSELVLDFLGVC